MNVKFSKIYTILVKNRHFILFSACALLLTALNLWRPEAQDLAEKQVRIALRSIGDDLLTYNNDFHSVVPPIEKLRNQKYLIKFSQPITIHPDELATSVETHISSRTSDRIIINVIDVDLKDVVHEFEIDHNNENTIPCKERNLKKARYQIEVNLYKKGTTNRLFSSVSFTGIAALLFLLFGFLALNRNTVKLRPEQVQGGWHLDSVNNYISFDGTKLKLTDKEMEIMLILTKNEGELVAREYLIEEIWSKQGVVTGRSLDMYISRLRKKLEKISTAQIVNEHGKGYRLINELLKPE